MYVSGLNTFRFIRNQSSTVQDSLATLNVCLHRLRAVGSARLSRKTDNKKGSMNCYEPLPSIQFMLSCSCVSTICSCVRTMTKRLSSMFNPLLCILTYNRIGARFSGGCWNSTDATTDRSGEGRVSKELPKATSPTSTSATSSRGASGNLASARSRRSPGRWGCRWRHGSRRLGNARKAERGDVIRKEGKHYVCV